MRAVNVFTIISDLRSALRRRPERRAPRWMPSIVARLHIPGVPARRSRAPGASLRHRAEHLAQGVAVVRRSAATVAADVRHRASAAPVRPLAMTAAGLIAGAGLMYYLDPSGGRRRRARVRDRLAHVRRIMTRDVPETVQRRGRFLGGIAKGVRHDAAELIPHHHARVGDDTLVARVRSEVLRDARYKAGEIHVDAYEGCVTLRGQLESEADVRDIVDRTRRVEGVSEVRSYLHLPGTPPPNKAEAYNGHVPAHLVR